MKKNIINLSVVSTFNDTITFTIGEQSRYGNDFGQNSCFVASNGITLCSATRPSTNALDSNIFYVRGGERISDDKCLIVTLNQFTKLCQACEEYNAKFNPSDKITQPKSKINYSVGKTILIERKDVEQILKDVYLPIWVEELFTKGIDNIPKVVKNNILSELSNEDLAKFLAEIDFLDTAFNILVPNGKDQDEYYGIVMVGEIDSIPHYYPVDNAFERCYVKEMKG